MVSVGFLRMWVLKIPPAPLALSMSRSRTDKKGCNMEFPLFSTDLLQSLSAIYVYL